MNIQIENDASASIKCMFGNDALSITAVGSRATCVPPPIDTDQDWLILVSNSFFSNGGVSSILGGAGFLLDNPSDHYRPEQSTFNSWRGPGNVNLIVTSDADWHARFLAATSVAKRLNLAAKPDRVALFQAVLYGNPCTD